MRLGRHIGLFIMIAVVASGLAGCRSTTATTARYRGDVLYGDGSQKRPDSVRHKAEGRKPFDVEAYAKDITDPYQRALVAEIAGWLGTPYQWGGHSKEGTDCSGLVMEVFRNVTGLKLPRVSRDQSRYVASLDHKTVEPGDLLFFAADSGLADVSHVGMYVGNGQMIHSSVSRGVMLSDVEVPYWQSRLYNAGRVAGGLVAWQGRAHDPHMPQVDERLLAAGQSDPLIDAAKDPVAVVASVSATHAVPAMPAASVVSDGSGGSQSETPAPADDLDRLLEMAITQKADSIFSSNFMD